MVKVSNNPSLERILTKLRKKALEKELPFDLGILKGKGAIYAFFPHPLEDIGLLGSTDPEVERVHNLYLEKAGGENYRLLKEITIELGLEECPASERLSGTSIREKMGAHGCCRLFRERKS